MPRPAAACLTIAIVPALMVGPLVAQAPTPSREVRAARAASGDIRLDGRLDEAVWQQAGVADGFTQREPVEAAPAGEATEVRFVITSDALFIGARMHSRNADRIRALVGRRDAGLPTEELLI